VCPDHWEGGAEIEGRFITFEGIDGSGKSTQINLLKKRLEALGRRVVTVREPGGTGISERVRELLLDHRNLEMDRHTETLLFSAARAQLVAEVILPALAEGTIVLCDRFAESTITYQGYGRQLPLQEIVTIQMFATQRLNPHLKVLLDVPVEVAAARILGTLADRMERAGREFQERVRRGYLELSQSEPKDWLVVDGSKPAEIIADEIGEYIEQNLLQDG
jgi:dTMP kinase